MQPCVAKLKKLQILKADQNDIDELTVAIGGLVVILIWCCYEVSSLKIILTVGSEL